MLKTWVDCVILKQQYLYTNRKRLKVQITMLSTKYLRLGCGIRDNFSLFFLFAYRYFVNFDNESPG